MKKQTMAVLGLSALGAFFFVENVRSNRYLKKERYIICSKKIPKAFHGKKIIFLSEFQNTQIGKDNKRLIDAIDREKPDYILAGGDMLVSKISNHSEEALKLMKILASRYPVYCGN